jgi:hypothetical protein
VIAGLYAKGKARHDTSGFVIDWFFNNNYSRSFTIFSNIGIIFNWLDYGVF